MQHATGRKVALLLVATLTVMSTGIIAPSLPRMAEAYRDAPHAELLTKLVLTAPALLIALCAPFAGAIIDRFGRLRLLYAALVLYGLAGAAGYLLRDLALVLASRAVLGVAIAGTMTTLTALVGDYYAGEARIRFAGTQSFFMSIGAVVAVGAGGLLADFDWRLPFLLYLSGWAVLVPAALHLHEPPRAAPAAADAPAEGLPVAKLAVAYGITFFCVAMFSMTPTQLPFLVREIGVASSAAGALPIVLVSLLAAGGSAWYGRMRQTQGVFGVYAWACVLMATGYALIGAVQVYAATLAGAVVAGVGVGLFFPNSNLWALSLAPPGLRGRVSGGLTAAVFLGQFFSPILLQPVVAHVGLPGAFLAAAAVLAAAALAAGVAARRE